MHKELALELCSKGLKTKAVSMDRRVGKSSFITPSSLLQIATFYFAA